MLIRNLFNFSATFFCFMLALPTSQASTFTPGDLLKGHAKFEDACDKCHKKFDKSGQRD